MSVKPPMGTGRVRLVMIGEDGKVDLQPCGGTHLSSTAAIGPSERRFRAAVEHFNPRALTRAA